MNSKIVYEETQAGLVAAGTIAISKEAVEHQVTVSCVGTTTAGTAAVAVKAVGSAVFSDLVDEAGDALALDLATAPHTIRYNGRFTEVKVTPDEAFDGDSITMTVSGW